MAVSWVFVECVPNEVTDGKPHSEQVAEPEVEADAPGLVPSDNATLHTRVRLGRDWEP